MRKSALLGLGGLALATMSLSACGTAADLSCDEIARQARELSQGQEVKFTEIREVREVSRTDRERRCSGTGVTAAGQNIPLTLRGYEENGNQLVAYEGTAPAEAPAPPAPTPTQ